MKHFTPIRIKRYYLYKSHCFFDQGVMEKQKNYLHLNFIIKGIQYRRPVKHEEIPIHSVWRDMVSNPRELLGKFWGSHTTLESSWFWKISYGWSCMIYKQNFKILSGSQKHSFALHSKRWSKKKNSALGLQNTDSDYYII